MKPHIHFHSDCTFFAGCENMLANFFTDPEFSRRFTLTFNYRYTSLYETGFRNRVKTDMKVIPLRLLDFNTVFETIPLKVIRTLMKLVYHVFLIKYLCIIWNTSRFFLLFGGYKIDILHINNGGYPGAYSCMAAVFAARLRGIRNIVYVVNNIASPYKHCGRWLDYLPDRLVARWVTRFVCGSTYAARALSRVLNIDPGKTLSISNGISSREVSETRMKVLERLNLQDNRLYLAVVAVLEERKGHIYLLKAMQLLKQIMKGVQLPILLIEGEGSLKNQLMEFAEDAGLTEEVRFIGVEKNIFNLMNAVDVIILPSIANEDFPNVILEAMCLGKPVIASRISGTPEQIEDQKSGMLVEPRDVQGLAKAVQLMLSDAALRETMSFNALNRFNKLFTVQAALRKYSQLYEQLIGNDAS